MHKACLDCYSTNSTKMDFCEETEANVDIGDSTVTEDSAFDSNPVRIDAFERVDNDCILSLFKKTVPVETTSPNPPVLPKEGHLYVYYLGQNSQFWERKKTMLRLVHLSYAQ